MKKDIFNLKLHEQLLIEDIGKTVIRVPGGWIYGNWNFINNCLDDDIFIPYCDGDNLNGK